MSTQGRGEGGTHHGTRRRLRRCMFLLNVGVTTLTERVPTATPGDDRGEEAKLRWEWVLESGGGGRRGMRRMEQPGIVAQSIWM